MVGRTVTPAVVHSREATAQWRRGVCRRLRILSFAKLPASRNPRLIEIELRGEDGRNVWRRMCVFGGRWTGWTEQRRPMMTVSAATAAAVGPLQHPCELSQVSQ